jgi:hypothetical protein
MLLQLIHDKRPFIESGDPELHRPFAVQESEGGVMVKKGFFNKGTFPSKNFE